MTLLPEQSLLKNQSGSILIVVLWTLIMIGYLVGDYLIHNRSKTGTAINLMTTFRQQNALESLLHLTSLDVWQAGIEDYVPGQWVEMTVTGVTLKFRMDDESARINLNTADDAQIRQAMVDILAETDMKLADYLTDGILDWRDENDLVRANGSEKRDYEAAGIGYVPADGFFKTLTEVLMVRGVTRDLFWGDLDRLPVIRDPDTRSDADEKKGGSLMESFTIFDSGTRRLSVLIPMPDSRVSLYYVFFIGGPGSTGVIEWYSEYMEGTLDL